MQNDHVYTHDQVDQLATLGATPYRAGTRAPFVDREGARSYRLVVPAHVAGKGPDALVLTGVKGGPLRSKIFQDAAMTPVASKIGVPGLTPHKLRHTATSLAIAAGANVKVVQQMLG